jgi:hypothetical protein
MIRGGDDAVQVSVLVHVRCVVPTAGHPLVGGVRGPVCAGSRGTLHIC